MNTLNKRHNSLDCLEPPDHLNISGGFVLYRICQIRWRTGMRMIFFFLLFAAFCAPGYSICNRLLHIGNDTMRLCTDKRTSPSLHVQFDNTIYYGNVFDFERTINLSSSRKLKVLDENNIYYVSELFDHVITDGKLVSANSNVYLQNDGASYIDTQIAGNTRYKYILDLQLVSADTLGPYRFFGVEVAGNSGSCPVAATHTKYEATDIITVGIYPQGDWFYAYSNPCNYATWDAIDTVRHSFQIDYIAGFMGRDSVNTYFWNGIPTGRTTTGYNVYLFVSNNGTIPNHNHVIKIYSYRVFDENNNLIQHLVPVPVGLHIGDFVVPANGMFDIVTQQFFGNAGTGEFIYGVD